MDKLLKKVFGGLELTWPKVIVAGTVVSLMKPTEYNTVSEEVEKWVKN